MTEVERYVRERVAETGEPWLVVPPDCPPSLLAVPLWKLFVEETEGLYVLVTGSSVPNTDEKRASATRSGLAQVERWVPEPPEGAAYVCQEGAVDVICRVEGTPLGLSLLQLRLNEVRSGLVIGVHP